MTIQDELVSAIRSESQPVATARAGLALGTVGVVLAVIGGRLVDSDTVDGYGLVLAMPVVYWMGVALGAAATGALLQAALGGEHRQVGAIVPLWLLLAHTAPATAHAHARFSIVYIHLGFIDVIDATSTGDILIDARFAWPGFFATFVPALSDIDPKSLDWLMRLWPTVVTGAAAALVWALATRSYPNRSLIGPISSLVFVLLSWTGQDYFSPQSVGFFLYLAIVIVLESGPLRPRGAWSSAAPFLSRFATAGGDRESARSTPSFVALLVLAAGAIVSHPLAPFFICAALAMLGIYGRTAAWRLLAIVGIGWLVWILIAAEPWWSTRVSELTGQFGSFFSNFQSSTAERVAESSPSHYFVTRMRTAVGLLTFVSTLVLGLAMATDRFRHLRPTLPLAPLAGIPVLAAALQSYGGEIIIRVLLFTLPMASILIARALLALPRQVLPVVIPVVCGAVLPPFLLARFGNEAFEMVTAVDLEAVEVMYREADADTVLFADNSFLPWGAVARHTNQHLYSDAEPTLDWIESLRAEAAEAGGERLLVVFTPSQSAWREHVESAPPGSLDQIGTWMSNQSDVTVVYRSEGAWVFEIPV